MTLLTPMKNVHSVTQQMVTKSLVKFLPSVKKRPKTLKIPTKKKIQKKKMIKTLKKGFLD
jgi:hypothetical protein